MVLPTLICQGKKRVLGVRSLTLTFYSACDLTKSQPLHSTDRKAWVSSLQALPAKEKLHNCDLSLIWDNSQGETPRLSTLWGYSPSLLNCILSNTFSYVLFQVPGTPLCSTICAAILQTVWGICLGGRWDSVFISFPAFFRQIIIRALGDTRKKTAFVLREHSNPCMSKEAGKCLEKRQLLPMYLKDSVYLLNLCRSHGQLQKGALFPPVCLSCLLGLAVASLPYPTL